jgi:signal recognition particle subunit SRP54
VVKGSGRKEAELNKLLAEWEKAKEKAEVMGKNIRSGKNPFSSFGF